MIRHKMAMVAESVITQHVQKISKLGGKCVEKKRTCGDFKTHGSCSFDSEILVPRYQENHGVFAARIHENSILCCVFHDPDCGSDVCGVNFYIIDTAPRTIMRPKSRPSDGEVKSSLDLYKIPDNVVEAFSFLSQHYDVVTIEFDYLVYAMPYRDHQKDRIFCSGIDVQHCFDSIVDVIKSVKPEGIDSDTWINSVYNAISSSNLTKNLHFLFRNSENPMYSNFPHVQFGFNQSTDNLLYLLAG